MAKEKTVSILGCGWLGLPVAENLLVAGYVVKGSTTTVAKLDLLSKKGIQPFLINLADEATTTVLPAFLQTDYLIISYPPGLRAGNGDEYLSQIKAFIPILAAAPVQQILFISSTSVYPDLNRIVTESEDLRPYLSRNHLVQAEDLIASLPGKSTTIVRMSGLTGGSRHPGRFMAGKQNVPNPAAPVNLIHLDDCVNIISKILAKNDWGTVYNACADEHPTRLEFYTAAAQKLNLAPPQFAPAATADGYKIVSNQKIKAALSYEFIHPDPMLFF